MMGDRSEVRCCPGEDQTEQIEGTMNSLFDAGARSYSMSTYNERVDWYGYHWQSEKLRKR